MTPLSKNFTLEELIYSDTAARFDIDNTPPASIMPSLRLLATKLEFIREDLYNRPLRIYSGYRCPELNKRVGGSTNSAHMSGLAADFICPGYGSNAMVAQTIAESGLEFDQLILEYGWVHIGFRVGSNRREVMTKKSAKSPYLKGLHV